MAVAGDRESGHRSSDDATSDDQAGWEAAQVLYQHGPDHPITERFTVEFAEAALVELSRLMTDDMPGLLRAMLEGATASAEQLNVERLAGLVEILQNADDEHASEVRLSVRHTGHGAELLIAHDGDRVGLVDTAAMALAYVSTKRGDDKSKGKYGIGLKTLGRISSGMAVHCHPYHFEVATAGPRLAAAEPDVPGFYHGDRLETLLVLSLREGIDEQALVAWFEDFDPGSMLFLDTVRAIRWHHLLAGSVEERRLEVAQLSVADWDGWPVRIDRVSDFANGQTWTRHSTERRRPANLKRAGKKTADVVPLAVAMHHRGVRTGPCRSTYRNAHRVAVRDQCAVRSEHISYSSTARGLERMVAW